MAQSRAPRRCGNTIGTYCTTYTSMSGYTLCALVLVELILAFWELKWMKKTGGLPLVAFTTAMVVLTSYGIAKRVDMSKWGCSSSR